MWTLLLHIAVIIVLSSILLAKKMFNHPKNRDNNGTAVRFNPEPQTDISSDIIPMEAAEVKPKVVLRLQKGERSLIDMGFKSKQFPTDYQTKFPKVAIGDMLRFVVQTGVHPDVQINIGDITFHCHSIVLQGYSQYFHEIRTDPIMYLPANKITSKGFQLAYSWMLADEPKIERDGLLELYQASVFLNITDLHKQLCEHLQNTRFFREDSAFCLYMEARTLGLTSVQSLMLPRFSKVFLAIVASREFLDLNIEEVCQLLQSDAIAVHTEMDVLMAAVRWTAHDWEKRQIYVACLGSCIRFGLLDAVVLVNLNKCSDSLEIRRFIENPIIKQFISDGITFAAASEAQNSKTSPTFLHILSNASASRPTQRMLIEETLYTEPYKYCCENDDCNSYESFIVYLDMVRTVGRNHWTTLKMKSDEKKRVTLLEDVKSSSNESNLKYKTL